MLKNIGSNFKRVRIPLNRPAQSFLTCKPNSSGRIASWLCRGYSNNAEPKTKESGKKTPKPSGKLLLLLGALAVGSTVVSLSYQKTDPAEFLEEAPEEVKKEYKKPKQPAFSPDQVSVVFVLGGPGAGKGTQCAKLVNDYHFVHLSAGDLLRAEREREGSKYGELISHYIKEGLIVPQEVTVALLKQAITENFEKGSTKFLVDGFPRKMDQAITFEQEIVPSKFVLFFDCPEKVMLERLLERGKTSGRDDDNIESIKKRFRTFIETSMPVVEYFDKQAKVVRVGCDHPVDEVYRNVQTAVEQKVGKN
ncbi:hypothetical protein HG536_0G00170 [Torulaspora globosa]|uniref:Uridylate kinase n=1 Tax=Torulaspora globosa TaxID=48254 RepID=A0A7G3ZKX4_9SACH|nr:uncharacterized protein HG536_0G00170 [Torulaspora globosa]QLL34160.1 hypothetical protein HG536_0G00170 [Torulaspora globosa]